MGEETLRKMAIRQYLQGKPPSSIYREMGRSKKWFFKWLHRYQFGDPNWYQDQSRAPRSYPHQTSPEIHKLIVTIRTALEENPYAQIGTSAIKWECEKLGITPPSDSTINRVLKQEGLIKKNSLYPQGSRIPLFHRSPLVQHYPSGRSHRPQIHQGRRTLLLPQCHGSLQSPSLLHPQRRKDDDTVALGLIRCWKTIGIPDLLQFDNALCFRGSNRHPRSFGIVIKLCLLLGIEVVFIPIGEPWRNGAVESFNDTYNRRFFRTQWFRSYRHLRSQSKNFELFHNRHHRYSCLKGKTPFQVVQESDYTPILLPPRFTLPNIDHIPDGTISLIRFIRSDRKLDVFGEHFELPQSLIYTYVRAKIITALHQVQVYLGEDLVTILLYRLPAWITPDP